MHIKIECPRCKQSLSVPKKKAGGYVQCPRCKGSLWVSENLAESADGDRPDGSMPAETVAAPVAAMPAAAPAVRVHSIPLPPAAEPGAAAASPVPPPPPSPPSSPPPPSPSGSGGMPTVAIPRPSGVGAGAVTKFRAAAPPPSPAGSAPAATSSGPPPATRKTARFITADAAQSGIKVAADGKLPELHLQEGNQKDKSDAAGKGVSPLLLVAVLALSVMMCMALVLMPGGSEDENLLARRAYARQTIADKYFSDLDPKKQLEPYQILLREAQAAYSRGDRATEVNRYHRVLDMLRREHSAFDRGLTGSPSRDRELEEQLTVLLGG